MGNGESTANCEEYTAEITELKKKLESQSQSGVAAASVAAGVDVSGSAEIKSELKSNEPIDANSDGALLVGQSEGRGDEITSSSLNGDVQTLPTGAGEVDPEKNSLGGGSYQSKKSKKFKKFKKSKNQKIKKSKINRNSYRYRYRK